MPKKRVRRHEVVQPLGTDYRYIPLNHNQNAIVDAEDFERLSQWNWFAKWANNTHSFYACRTDYVCGKCKTVRMQNVILGCPSGMLVDHRNLNSLDNRKKNLRHATYSQNACNSSRKSGSGFRGVYWHKRIKQWEAQIRHKNVLISIGYFDSPEEAAHARDEHAKILHGEFACLNFDTNREATEATSPSENTSDA